MMLVCKFIFKEAKEKVFFIPLPHFIIDAEGVLFSMTDKMQPVPLRAALFNQVK